MSSSNKGGIQALLAAEQDAQHIVTNARSAKTARLEGTKQLWSQSVSPSLSSGLLCSLVLSPVARERLAMAITLPVPGLSLPLKLRRASHAHAPLLDLVALSLIRSVRVARSTQVCACQALCVDPIAPNPSEPDVASGRSVEHCSRSGKSIEELLGRASALAVVVLLLSAGASLADEEGVVAAIDGSELGISTTVSALFIAATIGLVVLTGGVIYLGLSEFLEKRAIQEEQNKVEQELKSKKPSKQATRAAARAGGPKGFGSNKRTKGDVEDIGGSD